LEERQEAATTTALTQFIIGNAVSLAERCVARTTKDAKDVKRKSKKSRGIVEKFLNQVHSLVHLTERRHAPNKVTCDDKTKIAISVTSHFSQFKFGSFSN